MSRVGRAVSSDDGLAGWRVAVTRPADAAERLARLVRAEGGKPVVVPLIRIAAPAESAPLSRAAALLSRYDWLVFTSANAVDALLRAASASGVEVDALAGVRVAAVGPATAAAARSAGLTVRAVPATQVGEAVAGAMLEAGLRPRERVLWPRAAGARDALIDRLAAVGATVDVVEAYRTLGDTDAGARLAAAVRAGRFDALTFTSPSAVAAFVEGARGTGGLPGRGAAVIAVIGPVTGAAARRAGLEIDVEPADHTLEAMVAALVEERRGGSAE